MNCQKLLYIPKLFCSVNDHGQLFESYGKSTKYHFFQLTTVNLVATLAVLLLVGGTIALLLVTHYEEAASKQNKQIASFLK